MNISKHATVAAMAVMAAACSREETVDAPTTEFIDMLEIPLGDVSFPNSCDGDAANLVERGVGLLHHMMYTNANLVFGMANDADPDCALAYWGQAMTEIHPVWPDTPSAESMARGQALVEQSLAIGGSDARENAYLNTARAYFEETETLSEPERLTRYEAAWRVLFEQYPDDLEAKAFYALAFLATSDRNDTTFAQQKASGKIAEEVLAASPNHPGAQHYIIHSYDYPALAEKARPVADTYGRLAPKVSHATHMMTHIYTRLGDWDQSIEWNLASAGAAWALCNQLGEILPDYTHALDYLAYAYLQKGEDAAALDVLEDADELKPPYSALNPDASAYAFAALPARFALERNDWQAAAALAPRSPDNFPWQEKHDQYVAITYFARAIANARLGEVAEAERDIHELNNLHDRLAAVSPYWTKQVAIQIAASNAWLIYAQGDQNAAIDEMQRAAALEASTEKHPITPGEIVPAIELLGDMLRDAGQYDEALAAYERALVRNPRRYNSVYGAGVAAMEIGDNASAKKHLSALVEMTKDSRGTRASIKDAKARLQTL